MGTISYALTILKRENNNFLTRCCNVSVVGSWSSRLEARLSGLSPKDVKLDSGYPHDGRADKNPYPHDRRADKNPYPHDRRADKDSYPHDGNNQCIILRLQLSFVMINVQLMLV